MKAFLFSIKKNYYEFSATSHGKDFVVNIGGNVKSNVRHQITSMKKDRPIVQDSESFAELAQKLVPSTKIQHFSDEETSNYKKNNPFRNSVSVNGIFNMHGWQWMDQRHNCGEILDTSNWHINIGRYKHKLSDNDEMRHSWLVMNNLFLWYHDVVKIIRCNYNTFCNYYWRSWKLELNEEIEIDCLKKSFCKWDIALCDLQSWTKHLEQNRKVH